MGAGVTPAEKQAARDKIAALRVRWMRSPVRGLCDDLGNYIVALEMLCDELTRPEPEAVHRYDPNECVVCKAQLLPPSEPPHCDDCIVTDEHYCAWEGADSRALTESFGSTELRPERNPE
jgi:hypothetical protein